MDAGSLPLTKPARRRLIVRPAAPAKAASVVGPFHGCAAPGGSCSALFQFLADRGEYGRRRWERARFTQANLIQQQPLAELVQLFMLCRQRARQGMAGQGFLDACGFCLQPLEGGLFSFTQFSGTSRRVRAPSSSVSARRTWRSISNSLYSTFSPLVPFLVDREHEE